MKRRGQITRSDGLYKIVGLAQKENSVQTLTREPETNGVEPEINEPETRTHKLPQNLIDQIAQAHQNVLNANMLAAQWVGFKHGLIRAYLIAEGLTPVEDNLDAIATAGAVTVAVDKPEP